MAVCKDLKAFSRTHEGIADFFSLLAVMLLFASVWATLEYYQPVLAWVGGNALVRTPMLVVALALNAFAILGLLAVGSARYDGEDDRCFGTFRGRRGSHSARGPISAWVRHMENVGKKHR
jgi:hypothetical protein